MSWLPKSLIPSTPPTPTVKDDISELTETLSRHFRGVASFLAPPPPPPPPPPRRPDPSQIPDSTRIRGDFTEIGAESSEIGGGDQAGVEGSDFGEIGGDLSDIGGDDQTGVEGSNFSEIDGDLSEIGGGDQARVEPVEGSDFSGRLRTGIERISNNAAVTGISRMASSFLAGGAESETEGEEEGEWEYTVSAVGLTDEVLAFAGNISMHPETWLDFPLFYDFEDCQDFDISDAQQEHALAVEHLLPRFAALRIELCPNHMTDGCFWKIYFVLLHSRLSKHDADLLSTPQIVEARAMLLQRLQTQMKEESANVNRGYRNTDEYLDTPEAVSHCESRLGNTLATPTFFTSSDYASEEHRVLSNEMDNAVVAERPSMPVGISIQNYVDDHEGDAWLEEESRALHDSGAAGIPLIDEDVSFSDLEDDADCSMPLGYKAVMTSSSSRIGDTGQWSHLSKSTSYTHTKAMRTNDSLDPDDDFDTFMRQ